MDTQAINLKIQTAEAAASLKDVKTSLKDIKDAMLAVGEDSPEFDKLAAAAAKLKDRVEEANEKINNMNPDQFAGLQRIAQGAATGIQLMTSSMALFGAESEEVQKAMMKVQAAMALADAVNNIEKVGKAFEDLYKIIIANPILAIAAALIAVGTAVYSWYQNQKDLNSEVTKANKAYEAQKETTEQLTREYDRQIKTLEAQGASEKDIVEVKKKKIDAEIAELKSSNALHVAKIRDIKDNDDLEESYWRVMEAALRKIGADEKADAIAKFIQQQKYQRAKDDIDALKENQQQIEDLVNERQNLDIELTRHIAEQSDERIKIYHKEWVEINAIQAEGIQDTGDQLNEMQLLVADGMNEAHAMVATGIYATQEKIINASKKLQATNTKWAVDQAASLLGSLSEITKKHAKLSKGFAIGQAIINTYQGVTKALATLPPPASYVAAAATLAAGIANVMKIKNTDTEGGAASISSGGGELSGATSSMNTQPQGVQPSTLLDENGNVVNNQQPQQQNNRVFVVESDITHTQQQVNVVQTAMRF